MQSPAAWSGLTLSPSAVSCWHIDATSTSRVACQCSWSLDLALALARFNGSRDCVGIRLALHGSTLCLLCAKRQSSGTRVLALAFFHVQGMSNGVRRWHLSTRNALFGFRMVPKVCRQNVFVCLTAKSPNRFLLTAVVERSPYYQSLPHGLPKIFHFCVL
jgi:hypothetical protein